MTQLKIDSLEARCLRRAKRCVGRSLYLPTEAPHFQIAVDGQRYVFCTIHKNASSSIRALIDAASPYERQADESVFRFLFLNHLARFREAFDTADHVLAFVKNPLHRVASCFQNKFIQRKGNRTIFRDYERVTGRDPANATFEQFVCDYIAASFKGEAVDKRRDRHIYTQLQQLLPVPYDVVASVDQFNETMGNLGLAHLLPGRANATENTAETAGAWGQTSEVLHTEYRESGQTPTRGSLLNEALVAEIHHLYRADFRAFGHLFGAEAV